MAGRLKDTRIMCEANTTCFMCYSISIIKKNIVSIVCDVGT